MSDLSKDMFIGHKPFECQCPICKAVKERIKADIDKGSEKLILTLKKANIIAKR